MNVSYHTHRCKPRNGADLAAYACAAGGMPFSSSGLYGKQAELKRSSAVLPYPRVATVTGLRG